MRATFGMEMTELPLKEKVTLQQRRGIDFVVLRLTCVGLLLTRAHQRRKRPKRQLQAATLGY